MTVKELNNILLCIIVFAFILSCGEKITKQGPKEVPKTEKEGIGLYVYIDRAWVLHTKNGCKAVYKDHNMQEVRPVNPEEVTRSNLKRVCSQCVTESQLIELEGIVEAVHVVESMQADSVAAEADYDPDRDDPDNNGDY